MSIAYQITYLYEDESDPEVEEKVMKLANFLGGVKNDGNSDAGQLCVCIRGKTDMHDLVDMGLSLPAFSMVSVESYEEGE